MDVISSPIKWQIAFIYIDSIVAFPCSPRDYIEHVRKVLSLLWNAIGALKIKKCISFTVTVKHLSHFIRSCCLAIGTHTMDAPKGLTKPTNITQLCSFFWLMQLIRSICAKVWRSCSFTQPNAEEKSANVLCCFISGGVQCNTSITRHTCVTTSTWVTIRSRPLEFWHQWMQRATRMYTATGAARWHYETRRWLVTVCDQGRGGLRHNTAWISRKSMVRIDVTYLPRRHTLYSPNRSLLVEMNLEAYKRDRVFDTLAPSPFWIQICCFPSPRHLKSML